MKMIAQEAEVKKLISKVSTPAARIIIVHKTAFAAAIIVRTVVRPHDLCP